MLVKKFLLWFLTLGRGRLAERATLRYLRVFPRSRRAYVLLSQIYRSQKETKLAARMLARAAPYAPNPTSYDLAAIKILLRRHKVIRAEPYLYKMATRQRSTEWFDHVLQAVDGILASST